MRQLFSSRPEREGPEFDVLLPFEIAFVDASIGRRAGVGRIARTGGIARVQS